MGGGYLRHTEDVYITRRIQHRQQQFHVHSHSIVFISQLQQSDFCITILTNSLFEINILVCRSRGLSLLFVLFILFLTLNHSGTIQVWTSRVENYFSGKKYYRLSMSFPAAKQEGSRINGHLPSVRFFHNSILLFLSPS